MLRDKQALLLIGAAVLTLLTCYGLFPSAFTWAIETQFAKTKQQLVEQIQ
jgi:hypothetical protein